MIYCIDGYNLLFALGLDFTHQTHRTRKQTPASIHAVRNQLIDQLHHYTHHLNLNALLVFDGKTSTHVYYPTPLKTPGELKIIYTDSTYSADEYLVSYIKRHRTYPLCVVTNDQMIQSQAHIHRAQHLAPLPFWQLLLKKTEALTTLPSHSTIPLNLFPSLKIYEEIFEQELLESSSYDTFDPPPRKTPLPKKETSSKPLSPMEEKWLDFFESQIPPIKKK